MNSVANITVIGAGFGAVTAIKTLRKSNPSARITLIAPEPTMQYYPSLIWVPAELRSRDDIMVDLKPLLARLDVIYQPGRVVGVEGSGRRVLVEQGGETIGVDNDGLIVASGGRFIKKLPGIEHAITVCEGIDAAERIRDRLAAMTGGTIAIGFGGNPNEPSAVRGGPMFEMLFGIDRLLRKQGRRDQFKIVFFNPSNRPGNRLGESAVDNLLARMKKFNIEARLGAKMLRFEADKVVTEAGEFAADLILFMPGMTGPTWLEHAPFPKSPGGMIQAEATTRVVGFEKVYVVGDSGSYPAPDWAPKQAHMADLMAVAAAHNLLAEQAGKPANQTFKWELICVMDMLDRAVLVFRNEKRQFITPPCRLLHYAKRLFEWWYLRSIR
ncbi:NAD(P)/FAD-dependent oxidoreductase [Halothiobacillus neapolitanus]|uniref:FAD-dependent pyridine nucleotide-disulphide oxidoreductase n=1 Tax=Halothiobacillus neapolitanus (strain ATCC 23641 / DSM 15147 / CIP 104769 / NCIMB 8539 / c2) TaxID=555778 RepID=D0KXE7_HALNC|nr:FAD-dependent oxidoreductase [Halothiobacillus neapolitanus]ACX95161.1 FAD-dependent pyridine nucleotide-disulphide oxidoreductase [Halothiobacillus neapolitanus c2]TDN60885.1 sulfide:quinone oxidoreductase [Halothiobacillus neapolitanus]